MKKTKQQEGGAATDGARRKTGFSVRGAETAAAPERTTRQQPPQTLNVKAAAPSWDWCKLSMEIIQAETF